MFCFELASTFFQPVDKFVLDQIANSEVHLKAPFSYSQYGDEERAIVMTKQHIIIGPKDLSENLLVCTEINFGLKFEVIYELDPLTNTPKQPQNYYGAKPLGFKLFRQYSQPIFVYISCLDLLNVWIKQLSKCINQFGFHELFKALKKLGKGSTATVYEVVRNTDGAKFAVKAFSKANTLESAKQKDKDSIINELSILRQLDNKNMMKLEGIFESENSLYLILEALGAGHMHSRALKRQCKFDVGETKLFMSCLLNGLAYLAEKNIVHRDIKLENIMLRNEETLEAVIADFGLAEKIDSEKNLFFRCGTPGFVSPEVINMEGEQSVTPKCDVFSAGIIFHIFLMRRPLFNGVDFKEVYLNNKNLNFDLNTAEYQSVNPEAMDLLRKMLVIDPRLRISAGEALHHPYLAGVANLGEGNSWESLYCHQPKTSVSTMSNRKMFNF